MARKALRVLILFLGACSVLVTARVGNDVETEPPVVEEEEEEVLVDEEGAIVEELAERMKPRDLVFDKVTGTAEPHQFFHLHHMKTGGTSMDHIIRCGLTRACSDNREVPYYRLSECGQSRYQACINNPDDRCRERVEESAVMSYCAPLFQTNQFDWNDASAITVIRNPIDRVWSMFRFETNRCYKCMELKDYYAFIDNGTVAELYDNPDDATTCVAQLLNHQTRNLLTSPMSKGFSEDNQTEEALYNLRNRFTVVGLTEQLPLAAQMIGYSFPWLAETVQGVSTKCELPHANASPSNNYCRPHYTHWDLPPHPDEETRKIIEQHNQQDMKVYEAAVQHFELQKRALGWGEETD